MFAGLLTAIKSAFGANGEQEDMPVPDSLSQDEPELTSDQDYLNLINKKFDEWYRYRYYFEPGWYLDMAFYLGVQWATWHPLDKQLVEGRAPSYRLRLTINQCMPLIKTMMGKLLQQNPRLSCKPMVVGEQSYSDARVGDRLLKGLWPKLCGTEKNQEWVAWAAITGNGYIKTLWDPSLGSSMEIPGYAPVRLGDISLVPMGPFSILIHPGTQNIEDPTEIMEDRCQTIEHLKSMYGPAARGLSKNDDDERWENSYEARLTSLIGPQASHARADVLKQRGLKRVRELWTDPQMLTESEQRKFPNGRLLVATKTQLLHKGPYPYSDEKHPYVHLKGELFPGRCLGATILDQVIPIQREYNAARSQIATARALTANPAIDVEKGHGIAKLTAEPGAVHTRNKGWMPPAWRQPPNMSPHLVESVRETIDDFQETSQVREVTRGEVPANISGVAVESLLEGDNTPLSLFANRLAAAYGRLGTKILNRAQQFYTEDRVISFAGEFNQWDVMVFRGDAHRTPMMVDCSPESVMPTSRAGRLARVSEAVQLGVLDPTAGDKSVILHLMEFGMIEEIIDDVELDRQKAVRENRMMLSGQPVMRAPFDNDAIHAVHHTRFMKTSQWEALPPKIKMFFMIHLNEHVQPLLALQAAAVAPPPGPPAA